jgi:hypothetical protein
MRTAGKGKSKTGGKDGRGENEFHRPL